MDAPLSDSEENSSSMYDVLPKEYMNSTENEIVRESIRKDIERSLSTLTIREGEVVRLYYGLNGKYPLTLEEIGEQGLARRAEDVVDRIGIEQRGAELWEHAYWLARRSFGAAGKATHVLTRRTLQILRDDPHLDLDRIARKLRTPASEVSRHFHRDASMTLVRYRSRLRLLRLIHLVDGGGHNLMTSAVEAGFGSYSQCHRIFRSELGCSPRQFFASGLRERMQRVYSP
jgi:AraC-like DNA-binding protein